MAYKPLGNNGNGPLDNIELQPVSHYDAGSYGYTPVGMGAADSTSMKSGMHADTKGLLQHAGTYKTPAASTWPIASQPPAELTPLRMGLMVFDAILASSPVMFLALAAIAAKLDGQEITDYGDRLKEVLLISPTIFPLLFAALMGRFFRHLAVFLAERGTTLGRLEQLIGCQSVFSALERQICLRTWSIIGLCTILVWLLSPLGGQAALRLLDKEMSGTITTTSLRYMNPITYMTSFLEGASAMNSERKTFTSLFLAALLSSSKYQETPMDLWGNVKLPIFRYLPETSGSDWREIQNVTTTNITYASLIGVPVAGVRTDGMNDFMLRARQFDITCNSNEEMGRNASGFGNLTVTWKLEPTEKNENNCGDITGVECKIPSCKGYPCPIRSISMGNDDEPKDIKFSVANCELSFDNYECGVRCNGTNCAVYKMRKLGLFEDGYTEDNNSFFINNYLSNIMYSFPSVDSFNVGSAAARGSNNQEKWINNPENFIGANGDNVELWRLSPELFAERLTILWNTFFQSTYGTRALGGNLPSNVSDTGLLISSYANVTFNSTDTTLVLPVAVYKTDWKWFTALLVCSLVLLIAAYAGLFLKYTTLAPDIIGYASSLTLLNPYVPTPSGGTTLHGLERAAYLHDLPIRIGDVCPNDQVGAIAFARADDGRVIGLSKSKRYV